MAPKPSPTIDPAAPSARASEVSAKPAEEKPTTRAEEDRRPAEAATVRCRVVAGTYGLREPAYRGEIIEVPAREVQRLRRAVTDDTGRPTGEFTYPILKPLEVEEADRRKAETPPPDVDRARVERERAASRERRSAERERLIREENADRARTVLANGGLMPGQPIGT